MTSLSELLELIRICEENERNEIIECSICVEEYSKSNFQKITEKCTHNNNICNACVDKHISSKMNDKGDIVIYCPYDGCGNEFEFNDVKRIVTKKVFERYDTLTLRKTLQNMPEFKWCKNASCGSGQIHFEGDNAPIMTCEACNSKSCYTHDVPWHEDKTCAEYEEYRQGADAATTDYLQQKTKACPKCGIKIEKNEGCNHMTCTISSCKYEFCWL
ncbi:5293_t:CDS:2 [Diversispora eburnea]|uniref:RBR-type E3 ubiquitin transferase n=1 Tax=Diversispora eburnea TaxID=1213867 RepID=A0A9N8YMR5_9GLOM|nr:5293_t:CDS:2 [Diversispora eburnea]